jgi:glycosyltransferase involved in cell wall biosynthesis
MARRQEWMSGDGAASARKPHVWIEVDELVRHFDGSLTPTGIDRVQAETIPHLVRGHPGRVSFMRLGRDSRTMSLMDYSGLSRLVDGNDYLARHPRPAVLLTMAKVRRYLSRRTAAKLRQLRARAELARFEAVVRPGDVLLSMSGTWARPHFGEMVGELKARYGIRYVAMFHDLLPVTHPQFVAPNQTPEFAHWLHSVAGLLDLALTPSRASAAALAGWLAANGRAAPPIRTVPFGAGFPSTTDPASVAEPARREHVLYVSTIEVRKNHLLLLRIWQRLIAQHGAERVPKLVFAGKYGWEIAELKSELARTGFLAGKIAVVRDIPDAEIAALYRKSFFTVFPSHCEGWGLPVAESLLYGRYCIASSATSLPEVGGAFADYHDPTDAEAAYRLIARAIFEPGFVAAKERRIAAGYRPPGWEGTADAIMEALDGLPVAG